jgi:hypothetical protein
VTRRALPMQIDGEPCLLAPSVITITWLNSAKMLARCVWARLSLPARVPSTASVW